MERVADMADCTLVAADGSTYKVSRAITALHSKVLGWARTKCCTVCCTKTQLHIQVLLLKLLDITCMAAVLSHDSELLEVAPCASQ